MASQYIARLGIVLGVDSAELQRGVDEAAKKFGRFAAQAKSDSNMAAKALLELKNETEAYGKTLTKVEQIEQQIKRGRFQLATDDLKKQLLAEAAAYDAKANAMKKVSGVMTDQQKLQMSYQMTDLATQIASGQNPMIALIQQGGQLKDSMGGLGNMFKALGSFITPFNVAIGASTVALGAFAYAAYEADQEFKQFQKSLTLTGNFAGVTADQLMSMSKSLASITNNTIGNATSALDALVASGNFTSVSLDSVAKAVLTYSKVAGVDGKEAAEKLMSGLNGSASGAKSLNDQMNFLTLAQYKQIEALEKSGKKQEAAKLVAEILNKQLDDQKRILSDVEKLWEDASNTMSKYWNKLKDALSGKSDNQSLLQKTKDDIAALEFSMGKGMSEKERQVYETRLANLKKKRDEIEGVIKSSEESIVPEGSKNDIQKYTEERDKRIALAAEAAKETAKANLAVESLYANDRQKIDLEAAAKTAEARAEINKKNQEEFGRFSAQNEQVLTAKLLEIQVDRIKKINDLETKNNIKNAQEQMDFQKEVDDARLAESQKKNEARRALGFKFLQEEKDLIFESTRLKMQSSMVGSSEKELQIAEARLQAQRDIVTLYERTDIDKIDKEFYESRIKRSLELKEMNYGLVESLQRVQGMYDAVWGNMSSAIDKFVRTGKGSMKDFTKSVIQDMLAMNMKLQAMAMLRQIMGFFRPFGGATAAGYMAGTTVGVSSGVNYSLGGSLTGRAVGGPVSSGTPYMIGEKGPELFVPSGSGTIIPNNQLGMGSTTNVTNNYINAIDAKSFEQRLLESNQAIWAANQYAGKNLATNYGRT